MGSMSLIHFQVTYFYFINGYDAYLRTCRLFIFFNCIACTELTFLPHIVMQIGKISLAVYMLRTFPGFTTSRLFHETYSLLVTTLNSYDD